MAATFTATAQQGETLDALCWRVLGRTRAVREAAMNSSNAALAKVKRRVAASSGWT